MTVSRIASPLGGVHASIRQRVRRRRRRAASADCWGDIDRAINPAFFRPALRDDLEISDFVRRNGERYSMVKTPVGPGYIRLTAEDRELLAMMDGTRSVKDIVVGHFRKSGSFALSSVADLVEELRQNGFLRQSYDPVVERAVAERRSRRSRLPRWMQRFARTRRLDFPGAHRFFDVFYRYGGRIFYVKPVAVVSAVLALTGVAAFVVVLGQGKYQLLGESAAASLLVLYAVDLASTFVHESGHALSCIHAGRKVNAAGFMLYLGMPAFFIETTDTWMADRKGRIIASGAGPFIESVTAGAASLLALALPVSGATSFFYRYAVLAYIGIAQNLVPFLRLDGYYILQDAMEEMNLRERSFEFVREELAGKVKRRERFTREEKILGGYGILAVVFTVLAVALSILFWSGILSDATRSAWRSGWVSRVLVSILLALILAPLLRVLIRAVRAVLRRLRVALRRVRRASERAWRTDALELFRALPVAGSIDEEASRQIVERARLVRVRRGEAVVRQGERGDEFYVVRNGTLEIVETGEDGIDRTVRRLDRGRSFGEAALLEGIRRTATVRAVDPSEVFAIDKGTFDRVFAPNVELSEEVRRLLMSVSELRALPPFAGLDEADAGRLLRGATWRSFAAGEQIVKQGDEGDAFYVISSGQVDVIQNRRRVGRLSAGSYFGEIALLTDEVRTATVRAATPVKVLELERRAFDRVLAKSFRRGKLAPSRSLLREWEH
jgi:CRP-like cAMP-binding protein